MNKLSQTPIPDSPSTGTPASYRTPGGTPTTWLDREVEKLDKERRFSETCKADKVMQAASPEISAGLEPDPGARNVDLQSRVPDLLHPDLLREVKVVYLQIATRGRIYWTLAGNHEIPLPSTPDFLMTTKQLIKEIDEDTFILCGITIALFFTYVAYLCIDAGVKPNKLFPLAIPIILFLIYTAETIWLRLRNRHILISPQAEEIFDLLIELLYTDTPQEDLPDRDKQLKEIVLRRKIIELGQEWEKQQADNNVTPASTQPQSTIPPQPAPAFLTPASTAPLPTEEVEEVTYEKPKTLTIQSR